MDDLLMSLATEVVENDKENISKESPAVQTSTQSQIKRSIGTIPLSGTSIVATDNGVRQFGARPEPRTLPRKTTTFKDLGQGSLVQRHSGLKIKNPLISSSQLETKVKNYAVVKLSELSGRDVRLGVEWCCLAVVGEVSKSLVTSHGKAYSIWKLTDLNETCIQLYMFGEAHDEFKREIQPGHIVLVVSPQMRQERGICSLSISKIETVCIVGTAAEFGFCQGRRKNGDKCTVPVNITKCPFCTHHVSSELKRLQSRRNELQGSALKASFRSGMQSKMHWLSGDFDASQKSRGRLKAKTPNELIEAAQRASQTYHSRNGSRFVSHVGHAESKDIVLEDVDGDPRSRAAALISAERHNLPQKGIPSFLKHSMTPSAVGDEDKTKKKRRDAPAEKVLKRLKPSKPSKQLDLPKKDAFNQAFEKVIREIESTAGPQGSLYKSIIDDEDTKVLDDAMDLLEKKDALAEKMDNIKCIKINAWRCDVCKLTSEYKRKECANDHGHAVRRVTNVVKRWWQCSGCKGRFSTLQVRYPVGRCPKCDVAGTDFISVSMLRPQRQFEHEQQGIKVAGLGHVVARGEERPWIHS